jgi:hypothetical protein
MNDFDEPRDRPKIKLVRNSKFDPQYEITVVPGFTPEQMDALRIEAVRQDEALQRDLGMRS